MRRWGVLPELSELLTSLARQTHSPRLYGEMGTRAGVEVPPHLFGTLARIRDLQPVRITDVAEVMESERSTTSRQITELTSLGLVGRAPDPADGRAVVVRLTPEGEAAIGKVYDAWHELLGGVLSSWTEDERRTLLELLRRLDAGLTEQFS